MRMAAFTIFFCAFISGCATTGGALHTASGKGDLTKMRQLLSSGSNVNDHEGDWSNIVDGWSPAGWGGPPLQHAAYYCQPDAARLLIEGGADVNAKGGLGFTALHRAAYKNCTSVIGVLLDSGAEIDATNQWGYSALMFASVMGSQSAVKLLVERGADPEEAAIMLDGKQGSDGLPSKAQHEASARMLRALASRGNAGQPSGEREDEGQEQYQSRRANTLARSNDSAVRTKANGKAKRNPASASAAAPPPASVRSDVDELPAMAARQNRNAYAIVIGVEEYRARLPRADFAAHDARTVSEYLTKAMGYPEENVVTLINDRALKSDMEKYFDKWLANNVEKGGTVFVYYSGHGAPNPKTGDAYLVPYDGDPTFIDQTGYPLKRLYESLGRLDAGQVVVALDSCFSGAGGKSVLPEGARPLVMNLARDAAIPKNTLVMAAAHGDQISSTYKEKGHGLFTYFLLKGLRGEADVEGDGSIEAEELFGYVKPLVERVARKVHNNEQSPQMITSFPENHRMVLIRRKQ